MNEPTAVAPRADPPPDGSPGSDAVDGAAAPDGACDRPSSARAPTGRAARRRLVVVGAVLVGAFCFLLVEGLGSSLNYFDTVDQALQHKASLGSQTFRLEGVVVPGTVHRIRDGVRFVAAGNVHSIAVVNHGAPPQLFQANVPVVVVGHFAGDTFVSDQVIVDHTAQYIEQHPNRVRAPNGTLR